MLLYNVTISLDPKVEEDWILWMQETHIPQVLETKCFYKCIFSKIRGKEAGECTFSILYKAKSEKAYNEYQELFAKKLQDDHSSRFAGHFNAFRTLMDIKNEFEE